MPTEKQIEAAAKMMCFLNGIQECVAPWRGEPCTAITCPHGMRDFGDEARKILEAAEKATEDMRAEDFVEKKLWPDYGDEEHRLLQTLATVVIAQHVSPGSMDYLNSTQRYSEVKEALKVVEAKRRAKNG